MAALVTLQLIPLPYTVWTSLPGREPYVAALKTAKVGPIWHSLTLSPDLTWNSLLALLPPVLFVCGVPVLKTRIRKLLFIGLFVTIIVSGFLGLLQTAAGPETSLRFYRITNVDAGVGLFANRNHQALFLAMGIPITGWLALRMGRLALGVTASAGATLFLLASVVATQSRMGSAIAALGLILTGFMLLRSRRPSKAVLYSLLGIAVVALAISVIALRAWSASRLGLSQDLRVTIFPETIQAATTFFPFGSGFGTFPDVFPRFEDMNDLQPSYFNHTHIEPTQLVIEGGLASLVLVAAFLAWYLRAAVRVWTNPAFRGDVGGDARLCSILIALPLLASLTDYPMRTPLIFCTVAAIVSVFGRLARYPGSGKRSNLTLDGE
jgi:O-antigen ligase